MPRPSLFTAIGVAGLVTAAAVSVTAVNFPPEHAAAAPAAAGPAPTTPVANTLSEIEASLNDVVDAADEVQRQATIFVGNYQKMLEQLRTADPAGTGTTTVGPTDVSLLLGIDNRIVWFDGVVGAPCAPYLLSSYGAYYCSLDDTIYIGSWVDTLTRGQRIFVYAHEDAHSAPHQAFATVAEEEAYADEQGGRRMAQLHAQGLVSDRDVAEARALLAGIGDPDHGTGAQRVRAFDRGYFG